MIQNDNGQVKAPKTAAPISFTIILHRKSENKQSYTNPPSTVYLRLATLCVLPQKYRLKCHKNADWHCWLA